MKISSHLYLSRHNVYYFRYVVPSGLRSLIGRSEIRRSLGTYDPKVALGQALKLSSEVERVFTAMGGKSQGYIFDIQSLVLKNLKTGVEFRLEGLKNPNTPAEQELLRQATEVIKTFGASGESATIIIGKTLEEVIADYCGDQVSKKLWTAKTEEENRKIFALFVRIVGKEKSLAELKREDIRRYRDVLGKLPPNMSKQAQYSGKSIDEILSLGLSKTLSQTTVKKHLTRLSGLFNWAVEEGYLQKNISKGVAPDDALKDQDKRVPFDREDLGKIFSQGVFKDKEKRLRPPPTNIGFL